MDWFDEEYVGRKTVNIQDLEDLSTACQDFILSRIDIRDLNDPVRVFDRANVSNKDVVRAKYYIDKYADRFVPQKQDITLMRKLTVTTPTLSRRGKKKEEKKNG